MSRRVVVTGLGALAPQSLNKNEFWATLSQGVSCVDYITQFDASVLPTQYAAEITNFDYESVLTPKYLRSVHRVVPFTIMATKEALTDANLIDCSDEIREEMDVIMGTAAHGLAYFEQQAKNMIANGYKSVSPHSCTGTFVGMLSSEVCMYFGFHGQSLVLSTGCTSASDAMGAAFNRIRYGGSSVVVTGGGESCISALVTGGFNRMNALSRAWNHDPKKGSRPFSLNRDGFVIGEGAWVLIFEELEHAKKRGAKIYAEIKGYSATSDAYHKTAPHPSGKDLIRAMDKSLRDAGLSKDHIGYINPHGTGTPLNDKTETYAIKQYFGERAYSIPVSSFKSSVGHSQGASGACGVLGTILAMQNSYVPPTINLDSPDPECDLDYVPNVGREHKFKHCLINSIAFGSRNSCLVLSTFEE